MASAAWCFCLHRSAWAHSHVQLQWGAAICQGQLNHEWNEILRSFLHWHTRQIAQSVNTNLSLSGAKHFGKIQYWKMYLRYDYGYLVPVWLGFVLMDCWIYFVCLWINYFHCLSNYFELKLKYQNVLKREKYVQIFQFLGTKVVQMQCAKRLQVQFPDLESFCVEFACSPCLTQPKDYTHIVFIGNSKRYVFLPPLTYMFVCESLQIMYLFPRFKAKNAAKRPSSTLKCILRMWIYFGGQLYIVVAA